MSTKKALKKMLERLEIFKAYQRMGIEYAGIRKYGDVYCLRMYDKVARVIYTFNSSGYAKRINDELEKKTPTYTILNPVNTYRGTYLNRYTYPNWSDLLAVALPRIMKYRTRVLLSQYVNSTQNIIDEMKRNFIS